MVENRDFSLLENSYRYYILKIISSQIGHLNNDEEDILQEVLVKIYNSKDKLDYNKNIKALVCIITLNECRNWHRKNQKYKEGISFETLYNYDNYYISIDYDIKQQLFEAINSLCDSDKQLFLLKGYYSYTYKEISKKFIIGMSPKQLKDRYSYVRKKLKKFFSTLYKD